MSQNNPEELIDNTISVMECAFCLSPATGFTDGHWRCLKHPGPSASDTINHPPHYKGKSIECIQVIESFDLGFNLGNVVKYVLRAGKKGDRREDLKKAAWYLQREIESE